MEEQIINLLLNENLILSKSLLNSLLEIDKDFDLNRFDLNRVPIECFASFKNNLGEDEYLNNSNAIHFKIKFPLKYKTIDDSNLSSDMNYFFRNIDKVIYIEEEKDRISWVTQERYKVFYHLKYDNNENNKKLKTFRFILNSYNTKPTNIMSYDLYKYYCIDGKISNEQEFKKISREIKLERIIEE